MAQLIDLTGKRFGRLQVLSRHEGKDKKTAHWNCICECGATTVSAGGNLRSGNTTSCGCQRQDSKTKIRPGMRFGRLTVLARDGVKRYGRVPMSMWHCACDCGAFKSVLGNSLMMGNTRSCGCLHSESVRARATAMFIDLTGREFGFMVVVARASRPGEGKGNIKWLCACACGNLTIVAGRTLTQGQTISCGCKQSTGRTYRTDSVRLKAQIHGARRRASERAALRVFDRELFELVEHEAYALKHLRKAATGIEWDVDHIVPLQSKIVCGFHNEFNLAVITAKENNAKRNYYWPNMP